MFDNSYTIKNYVPNIEADRGTTITITTELTSSNTLALRYKDKIILKSTDGFKVYVGDESGKFKFDIIDCKLIDYWGNLDGKEKYKILGEIQHGFIIVQDSEIGKEIEFDKYVELKF